MKSVRVSVPGRACFAGDHLDWMGGAVIACALENLRIYVRASTLLGSQSVVKVKSGEPFNTSSCFDVDEHAYDASHVLAYVRAVFKVMARLEYPVRGIEVGMSSTLPAEAGLGSSAAVCVATATALSKLLALSLSREEIARIAYEAEAVELGINCGQMDQYAVALGGIVYLDCSREPPSVERLSSRDDVALVLAIAQKRSAADVLRRLAWRYSERDPLLTKYSRATLEATQEMRRILSQPNWDPRALGEIMTACHSYLRDYAQLSTPALEDYVSACLKAGAYGAKATGAGRGGSMFALCHENQASRVKQQLDELDGQPLISRLADVGLRNESPCPGMPAKTHGSRL